jgi:hypothetical protein
VRDRPPAIVPHGHEDDPERAARVPSPGDGLLPLHGSDDRRVTVEPDARLEDLELLSS